jgi:pimeloyl-ACP methyl ester carboxylesterase
MLTRRALLAGAGALTLSGCGFWVRRAKEALQCGAAVPSNSPRGVSFRGTLDAFGGPPIGYEILLPYKADPRRVRDVFYFLPGRGNHNHNGADFPYPGELTDVTQHVPPFAVATLDGGDTYFHARLDGEDRGAAARGPLARAAAHHIGRAPRREAIGGYSMGGYGALLAAVKEPGRYVAVACGAPALFVNFSAEDHAVGDAFDDAAQYKDNDVFLLGARLPQRVLLRIGYDDPFLAAVEEFAKRYPRVHLDVEKGCHGGAFPIQSGLPLLTFAGRALAELSA